MSWKREVIAVHLMPRYVRVPQNERLREIIDGFERRWGLQLEPLMELTYPFCGHRTVLLIITIEKVTILF